MRSSRFHDNQKKDDLMRVNDIEACFCNLSLELASKLDNVFSAGEVAEGVVQTAKVQVGSTSRLQRRAITSDSSIPCSQKTR